MSEVRLGIDVACRADHQASLTDERGEFLWSSWKFRTTTADLERLSAKIPEDASVTVILEPTRNAWVPLSGWLQARGATVILVPPEQSADLRDCYNKHTKTNRLDSRVLARLPLLHPEGLRGIDNLRSFTGFVPKIDQSGLVSGRKASPRPVMPAWARPSTWRLTTVGTSTRRWSSAISDSSSSRASTTTRCCAHYRLS
jgi:hypothetical protein